MLELQLLPFINKYALHLIYFNIKKYMFMVYTNFEPPFKKNNFFLYNLNVNDNYKFKYFAINFIN